jgi:DNA-binding MarR family transcriptional regulator
MRPAAKTDGPLKADSLLRLVHWTSSASRQLRRRLAEIAGRHDLSDTELLVLWISSGGGRVQIELAGEIGVSPAQMSGIVERLRSRGLVEMRRQAVDRRRQECETTLLGSDVLARTARDLESLARSLADDLNADEQALAEALCQRLTAALKEAAPADKRASKEAA